MRNETLFIPTKYADGTRALAFASNVMSRSRTLARLVRLASAYNEEEARYASAYARRLARLRLAEVCELQHAHSDTCDARVMRACADLDASERALRLLACALEYVRASARERSQYWNDADEVPPSVRFALDSIGSRFGTHVEARTERKRARVATSREAREMSRRTFE